MVVLALLSAIDLILATTVLVVTTAAVTAASAAAALLALPKVAEVAKGTINPVLAAPSPLLLRYKCPICSIGSTIVSFLGFLVLRIWYS